MAHNQPPSAEVATVSHVLRTILACEAADPPVANTNNRPDPPAARTLLALRIEGLCGR